MTLPTKKSIAIVVAIVLTLLLTGKCRSSSHAETARIERGNLEVWSTYLGAIESQNVRNIVAEIRGSAALTEIIPDGTSVTQGTPVAKFDASQWEDNLLDAKKDLELATADHSSLVNAKIPLEMQELRTKLMAAEQKLKDEEQALIDTRELRSEDLVPEFEVKQLELKVSNAKAEIDGLNKTIELTRDYLHPAAIQRAEASLISASNAYINTKSKLEDSIIRAPCDGIAVHKPTNISGDFRSARVGDTVWRSQVFMTISDMNDLIARCDVPEPELTRITVGAEAVVQPIAYPDVELQGTVLTVGSMAQHLPGQPEGAKFFEIVVKIDPGHSGLRSDMSAQVRILSYKRQDVLLIPRTAVWWEDGKSYCYVARFGKQQKKLIKLGVSDNSHFEVLDGLEPGQKVIIK